MTLGVAKSNWQAGVSLQHKRLPPNWWVMGEDPAVFSDYASNIHWCCVQIKFGSKREQYSVYLKFGKTEFESGPERHIHLSLDLELG